MPTLKKRYKCKDCNRKLIVDKLEISGCKSVNAHGEVSVYACKDKATCRPYLSRKGMFPSFYKFHKDT